MTPNIKESDLRDTVIWLFYRKVLKLRRFRPLDRSVETFTVDDHLKARVVYLFSKDRTKEVFKLNVSKHEPLFFTVAKPKSFYKSEYCIDLKELELEFQKYFHRKAPILPT